MSEALTLFAALLAGTVLGIVFFGGLWWTIRIALLSPQPAAWFIVSLLLRTAVTLAGFNWASRGDCRSLVACVLGFLLSRTALTRLARETGGKGNQAGQEGGP